MLNILEPTEQVPNFIELETMFLNVLDYFNKAYMSMVGNMPFLYQREDEINDLLCIALENILAEENTTITVIPQRYDPAQRQIHGRASQVDFSIMWSASAAMKKYQFSIECKLLNCNGKNREYIQNGIHRYTSNFYAKDLPFAAMIGYIERGEVPTIVSDLNKRIHDEVTRGIQNTSTYWSSIHPRNENVDIRLYHLFFDFRDCQNNPFYIRPCPNNNGVIKSILQ